MSNEFQLPTDPSLWYNKDPQLLVNEQYAMAEVCPDALLGILISTGSLYWVIDISFHDRKMRVMFLYRPIFSGRAGTPSISVIPMIPTRERLCAFLKPAAQTRFDFDATVGQDCFAFPSVPGEPESAATCYLKFLQFLRDNGNF